MGEEKTLFNNFTLSVLIIILAVLLYTLFLPKSKTASVHFLDVGQGDAALIETPFNQRVLIDGGPNDQVVSRLDKIIPFYQKRLDAVVLTHPHADHLDGLLKVLETYKVQTVYLTGVLQTTPEYLEFLDILKQKNITTKNVYYDKSIELDGGIKINFLYPIVNLAGQKIENLNNSSIVTRLVWGTESFLFMGDLESESQTELLNTGQEIKSDVLKVAHHGSKDGVNVDFEKAVMPKYAIISVGKDNKFGHPSTKALDSLKSTTLFRTDQDGSVTCLFNKVFLSCEAKN